jgi:hypothetical protein
MKQNRPVPWRALLLSLMVVAAALLVLHRSRTLSQSLEADMPPPAAERLDRIPPVQAPRAPPKFVAASADGVPLPKRSEPVPPPRRGDFEGNDE